MKNKKKNPIQSILFGSILISISLGSIFWNSLIRYSYITFIIASASAGYYLFESITSNNKSKITKTVGIISVILLMLSLGIQTPALPFKKIILAGGVIFLAYGIFKKKL